MTAVALDAMGGDDAPQVTCEGAAIVAAEGVEIVLGGDEKALPTTPSAPPRSMAPVVERPSTLLAETAASCGCSSALSSASVASYPRRRRTCRMR